jgi:hypothetical protein
MTSGANFFVNLIATSNAKLSTIKAKKANNTWRGHKKRKDLSVTMDTLAVPRLLHLRRAELNS